MDIDDQLTPVNPDFQDGTQLDKIRNGLKVILSGTSDAEENQIVTVTLSDGSTSLSFEGIIDATGRWSVGNIGVDPTDNFDQSVPWTLVASVSDVAGNTVTDDLPTIIPADTIMLDEQQLISNQVLTQEFQTWFLQHLLQLFYFF